jgi:hypothetical protein
MFARKPLIGALALAVVLSACTSKKNEKPGLTKITVNSMGIFEDQTINSTEKGEKLALAAEQLMTAQSFMYADEVASVALSVDANNKRAQLIKALVAPAMVTKGILERVKPIAYRTNTSRQEYDKSIEGMLSAPNSALKTFLFDGQQDIKTEKDAQKVISQIHAAFDRLRVWLKENKDLELTLHVPAEFTEQTLKTQAEKCAADQISRGVYEINCDFTHALELKVNQADLEAAQHLAAGYEIYISLLNSYDLSGAIATSDKFSQVQKPGDGVILRALLKNKDFGVLRDGAGLKSILDMGLDALAGVRWAQKIQNDLCPNGLASSTNRDGYVLSAGICVDQDDRAIEGDSKYRTLGDVLKAVELALRGGNVVATFTGSLGTIDTEIKPSAFFANPVKDIRSMTPVRYDACGAVIGTADPTLGGVFVRGDANAVLLLDKDSCVKQYQ